MIGLLTAAWGAFRGSRVYRYAALAIGLLAAVLLARRTWKQSGREEVERDAMEDAFDREADRRGLDARRVDDPVGELRKQWSRD